MIYLVGALWLLGDTDLRLALPLVVWLGLYVWLVAWTVPRVGAASKAFSDARSAITGRIVDSYTNIQSVKLFAHTRTEEAYAGEAIEHARRTFMAQMRMITLDGSRPDPDQRLPDRRGHRHRDRALAERRAPPSAPSPPPRR